MFFPILSNVSILLIFKLSTFLFFLIISIPLISQLTGLMLLTLHDNNLQYIGKVFTKAMASFGSMTIHGNPWDCSKCQLIDYFANNSFYNISQPDLELGLCSHPRHYAGRSIQSSILVDGCLEKATIRSWIQDETSRRALIICLVVTCILIIVVICLYWKRQEVKVLLYIKYNISFCRQHIADSNSKYRYDAFVSFNDHLYSFVNNELRMKLEHGHKKYR